MLRRPDGSTTALLPLQPVGDSIDLARVAAALQGVPEVQVLDIGGELGRMYQRYLGEARTQAALGGLGVLLLMAVALRRPRRVLAVCQPLLLAVLLTLGGLALLQVPMGILHLVGLLLVVAVGSNYALFFDMLQQGGQADDDTLASLLLANVTTVLGFGLDCGVQHPGPVGHRLRRGAGRAAGAGAGGSLHPPCGRPHGRTGSPGMTEFRRRKPRPPASPCSTVPDGRPAR